LAGLFGCKNPIQQEPADPLPVPIVRGIAEGSTYMAPVTVTWVDPQGTTVAATLAKDGGSPQSYVEGCLISTNGIYILIVVVTRTEDGKTASTVFHFTLSMTPPVLLAVPDQEAAVGENFYLNLAAYTSDDSDSSAALAYAVVLGPGEFIGPVYHARWAAPASESIGYSVTDSCGLSAAGTFRVEAVQKPVVPLTFPSDTIFVSPDGTDTLGSGSLSNPCRTIGYGITRAQALSGSLVVVACGVYVEQVLLANRISLLGGYDSGFTTRNLDTLPVIMPRAGVTKTVLAVSITDVTLLEGFTVEGPVSLPASVSSAALHLTDCTDGLSVRKCRIIAGRGGDGADGANGSAGLAGISGTVGAPPVLQLSYTGSTTGGSGGMLVVAGVNVSGGIGGSAGVPVYNVSTGSGAAGANGGGAGGAGGISGDIASGGGVRPPASGSDFFLGKPGLPGAKGVNGTGGAAGSALGVISGGMWVAVSGVNGGNGTSGSGGGGGGAGGGVDDHVGSYDPNFVCIIGPSGSGGGSGGGYGSGGAGGAGGGGAFGIFLTFSSTPASVPVLEQNRIYCGQASDGGAGGRGASGGQGGAGAPRVSAGYPPVFAANLLAAGAGGNGGDGGYGGGGGGGAGGVSAGVFVHLKGYGGPLNYEAANVIETETGSVGVGGLGGWSPGNGGGDGASGSLSAVLVY
jgi:hypothetical protein